MDSQRKRILLADASGVWVEPIAAALGQHGWETIRAASGREALETLRTAHPDLIVLDLTLPDMDGLKWLRILRVNPAWRAIPVIVFTGVAQRDVVLQVLQLGVQGYILKSQSALPDLVTRIRKLAGPPDANRPAGPVPGAAPKAAGANGSAQPAATRPDARTSNRPAERLEPLSPGQVAEKLRHATQLGAAPAVLQHVIGLAASPTSSIDEVVEAVRNDQALALKVMRVANSSLFSTGRRVQTLREAGQRIGLSGIRNAVLAVASMQHFGDATDAGLVPQWFWEHSLGVAVLTQRIGAALHRADGDDLFLAGLLHDIGRLVLSQTFPQTYRKVLAAAAAENVDLRTLELRVFGTQHAEITRQTLTGWKLLPTVAEAAWRHDLPPAQLVRGAADPTAALIVAAANRLAAALLIGSSGNDMLYALDEYLAGLELPAEAAADVVRDALGQLQDKLIFYASQSGQSREHRAAELARTHRTRRRIAVLTSDHTVDALSAFFEQLGWLEPENPEVLVVPVDHATGDGAAPVPGPPPSGADPAVPVLHVGPADAPPATREGRWCAGLKLPCRYERLLHAVEELARKAAGPAGPPGSPPDALTPPACDHAAPTPR